jgi:hypothetical protein
VAHAQRQKLFEGASNPPVKYDGDLPTNSTADCYLSRTAIIVYRVALPKNTNAFRQIFARCSSYNNWPSPYWLSIGRPIFRWLFTRHVYNYRRAAGQPIAIFSERHSFPPYNFAKIGELFAVV